MRYCYKYESCLFHYLLENKQEKRQIINHVNPQNKALTERYYFAFVKCHKHLCSRAHRWSPVLRCWCVLYPVMMPAGSSEIWLLSRTNRSPLFLLASLEPIMWFKWLHKCFCMHLIRSSGIFYIFARVHHSQVQLKVSTRLIETSTLLSSLAGGYCLCVLLEYIFFCFAFILRCFVL